jgi:Biotin/lipoate A/B protein ligase family
MGPGRRQGMPLSAAATARPPLDLPPLYSLVTLRETGDAFAHACRIATEAGAGTLVHVGRFDVIEFALVLEPEEKLGEARRAFFACMAALGDSIAAVCPPDRPLSFEWPDTILFDNARIGGGRLGWPGRCREDEVPPWLVFSASLIRARMGIGEAGLMPGSTSLEEERFEEGSEAIVSGFCRYLMLAFDRWNESGFEAVAPGYLSRLTLGEGCRLAENGDLLMGGEGEPELRLPLVPALKEPAWLDPQTGGPKF